MKGVWQRVREAHGGETRSQPPCVEGACGIRALPGRGLLGGTGELLRGVTPVLWDHVDWGGAPCPRAGGWRPGTSPSARTTGRDAAGCGGAGLGHTDGAHGCLHTPARAGTCSGDGVGPCPWGTATSAEAWWSLQGSTCPARAWTAHLPLAALACAPSVRPAPTEPHLRHLLTHDQPPAHNGPPPSPSAGSKVSSVIPSMSSRGIP